LIATIELRDFGGEQEIATLQDLRFGVQHHLFLDKSRFHCGLHWDGLFRGVVVTR
jgi:hypothetical protein